MGLLATKKDDSELAEALHLEAVLVLDRLPEVKEHTCLSWLWNAQRVEYFRPKRD